MDPPTVFIHYCDEAVRDSTRFLLLSHGWTVQAVASLDELLQLPASVSGCLVFGGSPFGSAALTQLEMLRQRGFALPAVLTVALRDGAQARRAAIAMAEFADPHVASAVVDAVRRALAAGGAPAREWNGPTPFP